MLERLRKVMRRAGGMVLVTGPTGSGKTTTLYAILQELNTDERKIITVEDPVEYRLPGISQVQVHERIDLSFARVLRTALRQDPDIILVGEMRDSSTVETGLRAAMTGHLVLSTLHTNDSVSSPIRLLDMGAPAYMVALSLRVVIAQRLLRMVCEGCSERYRPSVQEQAWLEHYGRNTGDTELCKGSGCTRCNGTGYHGRTGVYEMLEMTEALVHAANETNASQFAAAGKKQIQGESLIDHAIDLVLAGKTTIDEVMRISEQLEE